VVTALAAPETIVDPIWAAALTTEQVTERQVEPALNAEELRMNREAKEFHPVYNNMAFPDPLDEPSRTVTATCTRVSRESIVIADPRATGRYRRLTIRERACLQGFPITYQFYAKSFSEKAKMVGNAIPPTFTYLLAMAARRVQADRLPSFAKAGQQLALPSRPAPITPPDKEGRSYPETRRFCAALPALRFKSGMRFELSNQLVDGTAEWRVRFFFGSSKDIREVDLDGSIERELRRAPLIGAVLAEARSSLLKAEAELRATNPAKLQLAWTHRAQGMGPFELTDLLGNLADEIHRSIDQKATADVRDYIAAYVVDSADHTFDGKLPSRTKLEKYALRIISGFVIGDWFNTLPWHNRRREAA
jgi:DNA (cytosine-5)-methyltransferase 1